MLLIFNHIFVCNSGEGNGNPLQDSCLENPRDRGAWWAAVSGGAQSRTRLKWLAAAVAVYSSVVFHCISIPQFRFIFSLSKYFDCLSPFLFLFQIMLFVTNVLLYISLSQMWEFLVLRYISKNKVTGWKRYIFSIFFVLTKFYKIL